MHNNKLTVYIGVVTVLSLPIFNTAAIATPLNAIMVDGNSFLYGDNLEVGIAPNGAFGSTVVSPTGVVQGKKLGYISDPSKQNFVNGYHGDFFLPQVSEEGWGIRFNDKVYNNNSNLQQSEIDGSIESANKTGTTALASWKGKVDGLEIIHNFRIYKTGLAIIIDISLKNTTANLMQDVYYMRTVDPDNNAEHNPTANDPNITVNTIMRQGDENGGAAVIAQQSVIPQADNLLTRTTPSTLGLCGHGANSRVIHGGTGVQYFPYYRDPKTVYESTQPKGDSATKDSPLAIAFKFDKIFPGQTVKFRAGYQLADITPPAIDLDTDNSSNAVGNSFKQVYKLGDTATPITDADLSVTGLDVGDDTLVGATIKLSNAHPEDKLTILGNLPNGISLNNDENNSDTEIHLTGSVNKDLYIQALQQITFVNNITTSMTETRDIAIIVVDSNYTASSAANSIIQIITPVTLTDDRVTEDNQINASEADSIIISGTAAAAISVTVVFTDKNGQTVTKTVLSNSTGNWTLSSDSIDISALADGAIKVKITSTNANNNPSSYSKETYKDANILLSITTPKNGSITANIAPVITGKSDPDASISLYITGGASYTTNADDAGDWSYTLPQQPLDATLNISISAKDALGNTKTESLNIKIPSLPLEVTKVELSTTPIFNGTSTAGTSITVTVPTTDGHSESCTTTTDANGNWSCQLPLLPSGGPYTAIVTTKDSNGKSTSLSYDVTIPALPLTIENPIDKSTLTNFSPKISGVSNPATVVVVTASTGETCLTMTDKDGKWNCQLSSLSLDTTLTISVVAKDDVNNTTSKNIEVTTPKNPPIPLEITGVELSTTPIFKGTSTPNTTITVTVPITGGNSETCTTTTDANGNWSCQLPILTSGGPYVAVIKTADSSGNSSSKTYSVTIPPLPLMVETPTDNTNISDSSPLVSGSSHPNAIVVITASTGESCLVITDKNGKWQCELAVLALDTKITLSIVANDKANNSATKNITITTPKLALKITGIDISTTPTIIGTSIANANISVSIPVSDTKTETCNTTATIAGSWSCTLPILPTGGPYIATVKAEDDKGNYATDTQIVAAPKLPLSIDSHADNASITDANPIIAGTSAVGSNITIVASTGQSCTAVTDNNSQWICKLSTLPLNQTITLVVKTEDSIGNSTSKTIKLTTPALPISITEIESSTTPMIRGNSTEGTLISVTIAINASTIETCTATTDTDGNWSCQLPTLPTGGPYIATVNAVDNKDNKATTTQTFTVPELALVISSPANNAVISAKNPTVSGSSIVGSKITVTSSTGETCLAVTDLSGQWSCQLTTLSLGISITLSVTALDEVNNSTSQSITVTTQQQASIPITVTKVEQSITPIFIGTSTAGTNISVTVPTTATHSEICTTTTDANGDWSCQLPMLVSGGPYSAIITSRDNTGNTSSITHDITVPQLELIIESPANYTNVTDSSPLVSGTSNPATQITVTASTGESCIDTTDEAGKWRCELPVLPLGTAITLNVLTKDAVNNSTTKTINLTTPLLALKITGVDISTTPTLTGTSISNAEITVTVPVSNTKSETCSTTTTSDRSWTCTLPMLPSGGPYVATVRAEDINGNYATDTQILAAPTLPLSIDSHADNAIINETTPTIAGTSAVASTVTLTASTGQRCSTTTNSEGQWECKLPALPLNQTISLVVKTEDNIGNNTIKTISLTTPALPVQINEITLSTTPIVRGTSTAGTAISVNIPINTSRTETCTAITDTDGNWSCQLPTLLTGGPYTATVIAIDNAQNSASTKQEFNVPELPLIIDSPTNNAVISGSTPTIAGTSTPTTKITVTASTGQSCSAITDSSHHWHCQLDSLPLDNRYTLNVTTEDSIGNKTTQSINISTDKLPLAVTSPLDKGTTGDATPNFIGTTTAGTKITITVGTGQECQSVADLEGNWSCQLPEIPVGGPYSVIIKAEDTENNVTTITQTISVPKTALIIISPTDGETLTGTNVVVTGSSDANTTITILSADGEKCITQSDTKGDWSCQLDNLQSGDNKHITVISGNKSSEQKILLVSVNIKNSGNKPKDDSDDDVTTIVNGGAGSLSFLSLFLIGLTLLLKHSIFKGFGRKIK